MLRHYIISSSIGGRSDTVLNHVVALTARKAHQLCIDDYLESYKLPLDIHVYTRTLFESEIEHEAVEYLKYLCVQTERKSVGFTNHTKQRH